MPAHLDLQPNISRYSPKRGGLQSNRQSHLSDNLWRWRLIVTNNNQHHALPTGDSGPFALESSARKRQLGHQIQFSLCQNVAGKPQITFTLAKFRAIITKELRKPFLKSGHTPLFSLPETFFQSTRKNDRSITGHLRE